MDGRENNSFCFVHIIKEFINEREIIKIRFLTTREIMEKR